jgi:hypothetical protein
MNTRWACNVVAMLCCQLGVVAPVYAEDMPWRLYRNDPDGFELRFPPNFVPGTYKRGLPPNLVRKLRDAGSREPFEEAIVLVDRARAGLRDLSALPSGEITAVTIEVLSRPEAESRIALGRQVYGQEVVEVTIGSQRRHKFPRLPWPKRDGCVLLPRATAQPHSSGVHSPSEVSGATTRGHRLRPCRRADYRNTPTLSALTLGLPHEGHNPGPWEPVRKVRPAAVHLRAA